MPVGWDDLRIALVIARTGALGGAAAVLGLDATTVGRRLAAIQTQLGYPLFERTPGGLVPTPAGRGVIADLEAMEQASLAAERKLAAVPEATGLVRIAATDSTAIDLLLDLLHPLADELPGIEIEIVATHAMVDLRRREADLSLRFAKPESGDLRVRRVGSLRWSMYGAPRYLAHRPRVDPQRGMEGHRLIRWRGRPQVTSWVDEHAAKATVVLSTAQLHVAIAAAERGFGLGVVPGSIAKGRGLVRVIDHAFDEPQLWLVFHRDLAKVPRIRAVADWLGARLGAAAERLRAL